MNDLRDHLIKYPHRRASTLVHLASKEAMTSKLIEENRQAAEAARHVNEFRDSIGYLNWFQRALKKIGRV